MSKENELTQPPHVYVMSAKFAPGHFSHMLAFYQLFQDHGDLVWLYLDRQYMPFWAEMQEYRVLFLDSMPVESPDILWIYNLSIHDASIIKSMRKKNPLLRIFFVYHEPWFGFRRWFQDWLFHRESTLESVKTLGRYVFVKDVLKASEKVLLPSIAAQKIYEESSFLKYNQNQVVFPLIFTDECKGEIHTSEKKYFSFISTATASKNFSLFLQYVRYKSKQNPETLFQITTRSNISSFLDHDLRRLIREGRLIVNHGHPISNAEINRAYSVSNCTWVLYARSAQSGVLCKSFMFGTPVIASDIGSFPEFVDENNGVILKDGYSLEDIDRAYARILASLDHYVQGARDAFFRFFHYERYAELFNEILQQQKQVEETT